MGLRREGTGEGLRREGTGKGLRRESTEWLSHLAVMFPGKEEPVPCVVQFIAAHAGAIISHHGTGLSRPSPRPLYLSCLPWGINLEASVPLRDPPQLMFI